MSNRQTPFLFSLLLVIFLSCNEKAKDSQATGEPIKKTSEIEFATGLAISSFDGYKTLTVKNPWPGSNKTFTYALVPKNGKAPQDQHFDAVVKVPIDRLVATSTTHIPSLQMLGETNSLIGFPNLDYISSESARKRIGQGKVAELGRNEAINTEILIDLKPDAVIGFAVEGNNAAFNTLEKTGIPILYNADWTETSPLGKAEWIKFFGALFQKEKEADSIFYHIKDAYLEAKKIASEARGKPTVISGAMYRDVWYMPQGNSWMARFIADANGNYLWKDSKGTGSLALNLEAVLDKGQQAQVWIGPGQFTSLQDMEKANSAYRQFKAFREGRVYSYSIKKGATGGVIYFEWAPNRPDLVLKDLIKILHPEALPQYEPSFFQKLE